MTLNRSNKPQPGNKISFNPPYFHNFKLNNGLEVYFIPKTELPIVRINLVLNCGSRFDPVNLKGLTNLVSMCIDEGAGEYNALQLSDEIDLIGAHFSVYSDDDSIYITLQVLAEHFDKGFDLFKKVLLSPHFNEKDFERDPNKRKLKKGEHKNLEIEFTENFKNHVESDFALSVEFDTGETLIFP